MSFFFQLPSLFLILSVVNNRVKKYENGKKKRLLTSIDIGDGKLHTVQQILLLDWPFAILTLLLF